METRELKPCLLLVVFVGVFCLPLLAGWEKMFYDDIACFFYPQQAFVSRSLQQGAIPWWDPHTFCGAKPYYMGFYQSSLYLLQWPFLLFTPATSSGLYFWAVRVPMALHFLLSALGGYFFSRLALGLCRWGSSIFSLAYTLSPTMTYMAATPTNLFAQAWLPVIGLFWLGYARLGRRWMLPAGILSVAVASPSGDMPFILQDFLNVGLLGIGYGLAAVFKNQKNVVRRLLVGGAVIFGGGMLLSGVYWVNMYAGLRLLFQEPEQLSGLNGIEQSLPPAYLVTLLFPDFFGGVTSHHTWGAAWKLDCSLNDANLSGGMSVLLVVFLSLATKSRDPKNSSDFPSLRGLQLVFAGMCVLSLAIVLGGYTPIYTFLAACPAFSMPYPIRYRVIECFALAGLLGVSVSLLIKRPPARFRGAVYCFLAGAVFVFVGALLIPYAPYSKPGHPGFEHLSSLSEWKWFIGSPFLIGLLFITMILSASLLRPRLFIRVLALLIVVELTYFGYLGLYRNRIFNRRIVDESSERFDEPDDHPFYREMKKWAERISWNDQMFRRGCYRSILSNLSWYDGSLSMLGFDSKPLVVRFMEALEPWAEGFPYELHPQKLESRFWPNQSVREFILPGWESTGSLRTRKTSGALPRVYLQTRWTVAAPAEQLRALGEADLNASGFCESATWKNRPRGMETSNPGAGGDSTIDEGVAVIRSQGNPNRLSVAVDAAFPCMLVVTDAWHPGWSATVDGTGSPVHRVNYCQRGIWLGAGKHRVEMSFTPPELKFGLILSVGGLAALALWGCRIRKKKING